jgi:hypothetical protein
LPHTPGCADGADAPVHHVGGCHHIGTGIGMRARLAHQGFHGQIVEDVAAFIQQTILTVRRIGIERDVRNDAKIGKCLFHGPHRLLRNALGIPGLARVDALLGIADIREQRDRRDLEPHQGFAFPQQLVHREPLDTGHGTHRLPLSAAFHHEHGVNQRVHRDLGFAHETSGKLVAAHAPQAAFRK